MNNRLYSYLSLHLKNIFTFKKPSTFANLLMDKPGNWSGLGKIWEKHLKRKEILIKGPTYLLKISLWDGFQFLYVQTNHLISLENRLQWVIPNN